MAGSASFKNAFGLKMFAFEVTMKFISDSFA